jgi:4-amino-4-deoxy-L-arabinose transferase-like glycosyltransferase
VKASRLGPILLAAALLVRVAWVLLRWNQVGTALEFPDEELHWQLARNLVEHGTLVTDDGRYAARMPAYPLLLAAFAWIGKSGILIARLGQAALGAAVAWIAYALASRVLGRRAGLTAGLLVCVDPYAVFFSNLLLTEMLFSLLAVGLTACAWHVMRGTERTKIAVVGVAVLGAAALMTRPSAVGWIPSLWFVLWLTDPQRRRATHRLTAYVGVLAVALLLWGARNRAVIGAPAWLSTNGGVTLYDAQGPQATGASDQAFLENMPELAGLGEVERDRRLRELAIERMRKNPGRVLSLAWAKFCRTWSLTPNVAGYRGGLTGAVSAVFTAAVLLLAVVGLGRAVVTRSRPAVHRRQARQLHLLLWLPVVYFTLLHCVFVGSLRYRVPLMPFLEIAAATAFAQQHAARSETSSGTAD